MRFEHVEISRIYVPENYLAVIHRQNTCEVIELTNVVMPIVVREEGDKYRLVDGYERYICARKLGWEKIPAIVMDQSHELTPDALGFTLNYVRGRYAGIDVILMVWQMATNKPYNTIATLLGRSAETVRRYTNAMDKLLHRIQITPKDIEELRVQKVPVKRILMCAGDSESREQFVECIFGKPRRKMAQIPPAVIPVATELAQDPDLRMAAETVKHVGVEQFQEILEAVKVIKEACGELSKAIGCIPTSIYRAIKVLCKSEI